MSVAARRCRVCGFELAPHEAAATRCPRCDAALGQLDPCPHCRAQAGVSPHPELRWVCDVCGGPRVPHLDRSIRYGGREAALLRKADAARKARAWWRAAAIVAGLLLPATLLMFGLLILFVGAYAVLVTLALFCAAPLATLLAIALVRAGARGREIPPALDAAWLAVATDIAQQAPGLTAAGLAEKLGIDEPQAEELVALLDVNAAVSAGPRMRIDALPAGAPPAPTAIPSVEEEAALAEQIAAEASVRRAPPPGKP